MLLPSRIFPPRSAGRAQSYNCPKARPCHTQLRHTRPCHTQVRHTRRHRVRSCMLALLRNDLLQNAGRFSFCMQRHLNKPIQSAVARLAAMTWEQPTQAQPILLWHTQRHRVRSYMLALLRNGLLRNAGTFSFCMLGHLTGSTRSAVGQELPAIRAPSMQVPAMRVPAMRVVAKPDR